MANETTLTIIGNLTADPEIRFTQSGAAVAGFTVASTPRVFNRQSGQWDDGDALFLRCSAWRDLGEHVMESLPKGARVIVTGRLRQRSYETTEGEKRTVFELDVEEIGPSLKFATATIRKTTRGSNGTPPPAGSNGTPPPAGSSAGEPAADPWTASAAANGAEPPF